MLTYKNDSLLILFSDKEHSISQTFLEKIKNNNELNSIPIFKKIKAKKIISLKQVHGDTGYIIKNSNDLKILQNCRTEGDYLITNLPNVFLTIFTADCLPIVMYDKKLNIIGAAHAGIRGTLKNIVLKVLLDFKKNFGSEIENLEIFFGSCAKSCCYEIQKDFIEKNCLEELTLINLLKNFSQINYLDNKNLTKEILEQSIKIRDNKFYFDISLYNQLILEKAGLNKGLIHLEYNLCTICNNSFCSHRRENINAERQITTVSINKNGSEIF